MHTRKYWEVKQADGKTQHRIRITDEPTDSPRMALFQLLREIADQPTNIDCGMATPDSIHIRFDGERWILDAEASVKSAS